ncbi:MAG: aldehyde dehydrogenase family protein [Pseudomonadota bacterium]
MPSLKPSYPLYLANVAMTPNQDLEVTDKYTGEVATRVAMADAATIDKAIAAAVEATEPMARMAAYERQAVLMHCVKRFQERFDELAYALCVEAGKPIKDARGEVTRLIDTFRIAAEESVRMTGEVQPLDISARAKGYQGMWKRVPIGPCSFISPFNFPLNLAAHKIAPALAVGCPFVMKPASRTPLGAIIIGEILAETDLPKGAFSILPATRDGADLFTTDDRLKLLSFTGSPDVGWALKAKAGKKKVVLELGGNAAVIVDRDADLEDAVERIIFGAFYQSGQSCIGVQRILIHADIYDAMRDMLVAKTKGLIAGNPHDETTFIGPMIDVKEAERLDGWVQEAVAAGATLLCGGKRSGAMLEATLVEGVARGLKLREEEAFGPVAILSSFTDFEAALAEVNDSKFGLQAGMFVRDIHKVMRAWDVLEVGGILVGDVPSYRVDNMPYGGVKDSGLGREGVKFAMEDMTEIRNLVIRQRPVEPAPRAKAAPAPAAEKAPEPDPEPAKPAKKGWFGR